MGVPKGTAAGNYTGNLTLSADSVPQQVIALTIEVPDDDSWNAVAGSATVFRKTSEAGVISAISINNTGNTDQAFTISYSGEVFDNSGLWDSTNPPGISVPKQSAASFDVRHKAYWQQGAYSLNVSLNDGSTESSTMLSLVLDDTPPAISIASPLDQAFVAGLADFNVSASDTNLSRLEFYIDGALVLNDTGIAFGFSWDTANGSYPDREYALKAVAYDSAGNLNSSSTNATVNNTDDSPILVGAIPETNWSEDSPATINLSAFFRSIDGDALGYNSTAPGNVSVAINNATGIATLTPQPDFYGTENIVFFAIDSGSNQTASNSVALNVANINDAPTAPAPTSPANNSVVFSATGSATLGWGVSADADNDALTYYVFFGNSTGLALNATTQQTSLAMAGLENSTAHFWRVYASDSANISANSSAFQFVITSDDSPVITGFAPPNAALSMAENEQLNFSINASDPDGGQLAYSWLVDGTLNQSGSSNFTYGAGFEDSGTHTVNATATDNNSNSVSRSLAVANINRLPEIQSMAAMTAQEDSLLSFNISASDADGDTLAYSSSAPGISITRLNNTLAAAAWVPSNDDVGVSIINITVSDGTDTASVTANISVNNTNDAPLASVTPVANATIADATGWANFSLAASDIDAGDVLAVSWFSNQSLIGTGYSVNITGLAPGDYNITAVVSDGAVNVSETRIVRSRDAPVSGRYTGSFASLNSSQLGSVSNVTIEQAASGLIDFGGTALDLREVADLDSVINISTGVIAVDTAAAPGLNGSASLTMRGLGFSRAPLIYLAPGFGAVGTTLCPDDICTNVSYNPATGVLSFRAAHFSTYFTGQNTSNDAPAITSTPVTTATVGIEYEYQAEASDTEGDAVTFSLLARPSGMSVNPSSGLVTWTPEETGTADVIILAGDGMNSSTQNFTITIGPGPRLAISKLDVVVDDSKKSAGNGTRIKAKAKPGSKVAFEMDVRNLFTDDEDVDLEDIGVTVTIEGIDDGDGLEEESDEFDLSARKKEKVELGFDIPVEVDDGNYDVIILLQGSDENGTSYDQEWQLELGVEKKRHEIAITSGELRQSAASCNSTASLDISLANIGRSDEENVALTAVSSGLGLDFRREGISLDEGTSNNRFRGAVSIPVPDAIAPGAYPIEVSAYYDTDVLSSTRTVQLAVESCPTYKPAAPEAPAEAAPEAQQALPAPLLLLNLPEETALDKAARLVSENEPLMAIIISIIISALGVALTLALIARVLSGKGR